MTTLYRRIHSAARQVCYMHGELSLSVAAKTSNCIEHGESRAVMRVDVPALSAYYEKKTGRPASSPVANAR